MNRHRHHAVIWRPLSLLLAAALLTGACAEERDAIDRVQPNALKKSTFDGRWYYQRTVVDVPASNGFTFVGNTDHGGLQIIKFDLQENTLFVRRDTALIKGADVKEKKGEDYQGEVIGAFAVLKHFDVKRAYNPTTGEELNILEENAIDRPWYEREYVRVDWSNNLVHNYQLDFERKSIESVPYYVQETNQDGTRNPDAPLFEKDGSYFDVTSRIFAKAGTIDYPGYGEIPVCWLLGEAGITECGSGQYSIRHSFLKIDPKRQYGTKPYKGAKTDMFGFFWSERYTYDEHHGITELGKERNLSRHNIWKNWYDFDGKLLAPKDRIPRPIVYHVNTDMPEELKPMVLGVGAQWNKVFKDVVAATGNPYQGDMFVTCPNNPVLAGDPPECGGEGFSPRLGDIRYSFMAYVPKYMKYGLLGLGPSNNDPLTGEIISGMAYLYHHNNTAAWDTVEKLELLNGDRDPAKFIDGLDLTDWVDTVNNKGRYEFRSLEDAETMVDRVAHNEYSKYWEGRRQPISPEDMAYQKAHGGHAFVEKAMEDMYKLGHLDGAMLGSKARLGAIKGTAIEKLLAHPEMKMAAGFAPDAPIDEPMLDAISPARDGFLAKVQDRERIRLDIAAKRNMYLPEMLDDALMGLAKEVKGKTSEEIYDIVRKSVYTAVFAHEVGHSLGLMHNFGGSDDVVNYFDDYWKLRDDGSVGPRILDPITDKEIDGKIYNYGYSSIMDYAGRLTIDGLGVGKYDRAAMLWGYADKVEVFKEAGKYPGMWPQWFSGRGEILQLGLTPMAFHYTELYKSIGSKMYEASNRMLVDESALSANLATAKVGDKDYYRVPYIYCSHGRSDLSDSCLTRDYGADSMERMQHFLQEWDTWYITRAFPRGKIGWSNYSYADRWMGRLYGRIKKWHDVYGLYAALLPRFYPPAAVKTFLSSPQAGFGAYTWAVQNAFQYLVETILMPDATGYSETVRADGTKLLAPSAFSGAPVNFGVDQARYYSTTWSFGGQGRECGYFWSECLSHIGFYIDKVLAIYAMSDSETYFVARASPIDIRDWHVSYYNTFAEPIRGINAALQSGDWSRVGPYLDKGKIRFPNYSGKLDQTHAQPIDPAADFTVQLYFSLLGQANFMSNYDHDFTDEAQIWVAGTWKAPDLPKGGVTHFTDPNNGLSYGALATKNGAGAAMIAHANKLVSRSNLCDPGPKNGPDGNDDARTETPDDDCVKGLTPAQRDQADAAVKKYVQLLKSVADMAFAMQYGHPLSP